MGRIAERVAEGLPEAPPRPGKLDRIMATLDDEDRAIVLGWLTADNMTNEVTAEKLNAVGVDISESSVRNWRRANIRTTWAA